MDRRTKRAKNYTTCKENVGKYFIFLGSKLLQNDCSHELKSHLLYGKQAMTCVLMTNLDSVLKSRDVTLPTEVHIVKAMVCTYTNHVQTTCTCSSHVQLGELDHKEG